MKIEVSGFLELSATLVELMKEMGGWIPERSAG